MIMIRLLQSIRDVLSGNSGGPTQINTTAAERSTSGTNIAIGVSNAPISIGPQSSLPGSPSSIQQPEVYQALLIYHDSDYQKARDLQTKLNKLKLPNGQLARVALEEDIEQSGQLETEAFNTYFKKNIFFYLFITEAFIKFNIDKWKIGVALGVSLKYGTVVGGERFVIPIYTENKERASYLSSEYTLREFKGIRYHGCLWNVDTEASFRKNLEEAEKIRLLIMNGTSVD